MIVKMWIALGITLVVIPILALGFIIWMSIGPYSNSPRPKQALASIFDGKTNPLENQKVEIVCRGFDCEKVIPYLLAVSRVRCVQEMFPVGACCLTRFGEAASEAASEVHIWSKGFGKYKVTLTSPRCLNPEFDPTADSESSEGKEWVPCEELWRSQLPASGRSDHEPRLDSRSPS